MFSLLDPWCAVIFMITKISGISSARWTFWRMWALTWCSNWPTQYKHGLAYPCSFLQISATLLVADFSRDLIDLRGTVIQNLPPPPTGPPSKNDQLSPEGVKSISRFTLTWQQSRSSLYLSHSIVAALKPRFAHSMVEGWLHKCRRGGPGLGGE